MNRFLNAFMSFRRFETSVNSRSVSQLSITDVLMMLELIAASRFVDRSAGARTRLPPMEQEVDGDPDDDAIVDACKFLSDGSEMMPERSMSEWFIQVVGSDGIDRPNPCSSGPSPKLRSLHIARVLHLLSKHEPTLPSSEEPGQHAVVVALGLCRFRS